MLFTERCKHMAEIMTTLEAVFCIRIMMLLTPKKKTLASSSDEFSCIRKKLPSHECSTAVAISRQNERSCTVD